MVLKKIDDIPGVIKRGKIIAKVGMVVPLPLEVIKTFYDQPRKFFNMNTDGDIAELAQSYKFSKDVEIPIAVVLINDSKLALIVDGERRYRAAIMARLSAISCIIKSPMSNKDLHRASFKANLQREDMSPVEIAMGLKKIMDDFGMGIPELSAETGKKESYIRYTLAFLRLDEKVQELIIGRRIEPGITRKFLSFQKRYHMIFVGKIREIVKKRGKPIHPNEAAKIIKKLAEEKGILPVKGGRGRESKSHAELVAGSVIVHAKNLKKVLKEFYDIDIEKINAMRFPSSFDIETSLGIARDSIESVLKKLSLTD